MCLFKANSLFHAPSSKATFHATEKKILSTYHYRSTFLKDFIKKDDFVQN